MIRFYNIILNKKKLKGLNKTTINNKVWDFKYKGWTDYWYGYNNEGENIDTII